jgi:hypothetical protein
MESMPTCERCDGVVFPEEARVELPRDRLLHVECWLPVAGRAVTNELHWSPPARGGSAAQAGLPSLGKRRP